MARNRRGRGEGGIHQREDGQWVAVVSLGYDGNGKRRRRVVYGKTKQEAQQKLREVQSAPDQLQDAKKITVGEYLRSWLLLIKSNVRATTHDRYSLLVARQIIPHLGRAKLAGLNALHVEQFYEALRQAGESPWQVFHSAVVLKTALRAAVRKGLLQVNPCDLTARPRQPKSEAKFWTAEEAKTFLAAARTDRFSAFFVMALHSGARSGELLGLQWPDVDFDGQAITVTHTLQELRGVLTLREPKTSSARRRIDLPDAAVEALLEHRRAMLAEGQDVRTGLVFPDRNGGPMRRSNLARQHYHGIIKQAGVPRIRVHDLRHSHASLMLAAGVNPKVVQERLGHAQISTTLGIYSHVAPTMQKEAARKVGQLLA